MSSPHVQGDDSYPASLSTMPPEVATKIFCQLPSFSDVFALSAVCGRLRRLWLQNVNPIYKQIAPKSIPCEPAARRFLVDQDGPGLGSPMSSEDVVRMVRNAGVIEKAILQFEQEIVRRVRVDIPGVADGFYELVEGKHPPTLTRTERPRFIRSYYTLWNLMRVDRSEWDSRLQGLTSQELYYLQEMTEFAQCEKSGEIVPPNQDRLQKPADLKQRIWEQIHRTSWRYFEQDALYTSCYAKHEGFFVFVVFWDHWQSSLKDVVCHETRSAIKLSPAVTKQYLWNDEMDE